MSIASKEFLEAIEDEIMNAYLDVIHHDDEDYVGYPVQFSADVCEEYRYRLVELQAWIENTVSRP